MRYFFLLIFLSLFNVSAHHDPLINFTEIDTWCSHLTLADSELKTMHTYLQFVKQLAQECINDLNWINSESGKELENEIDKIVDEMMGNQSLACLFREFTYLVKQELDQSREVYSLKNRNKFYYTILALVVDGCLGCVQKKLEQVHHES